MFTDSILLSFCWKICVFIIGKRVLFDKSIIVTHLLDKLLEILWRTIYYAYYVLEVSNQVK